MNTDGFKLKLGAWWKYFTPLFEGETMVNIYSELKKLKDKGVVVCPDSGNTFRSLYVCPPEKLKVIFVLMDPYPSVKNGVKVSNGIAMDCENTGILQPSLEKFYEAIEECYGDGLKLDMLRPPSLSYLYEQGVMFFNTALTVPENMTGAHIKLWNPFMEYFYTNVMDKFSGIIYVLCGDSSHKMEKYINPLSNYIYKIEHPSYAARQLRPWRHERVFHNINYLLKHNNGEQEQIQWALESAPF